MKTKLFFYILALAAIMAACSGPKGVVAIEPNDEAVTEEDSISYELIVLDPGFESWYLLHGTPAKYRSQSYYEGWNHQYVSAWNYNATSSRRRSFFQPIHGYEMESSSVTASSFGSMATTPLGPEQAAIIAARARI